LGPLSQAYNIVAYICSSTIYIVRFKELAGRIIPIDNYTRWNSWYNILDVFLNLRPIVEKYYIDYKEELKKDILNHPDWKKLYIIKEFLSPFIRATLAIEGDSTSINSTLFTIDVLIKYL
jgi:hypothetical protein